MARALARTFVTLGLALSTACPLAAAPAAALPPIGLSGTSGLVRIPTADVTPYGYYALGINIVDAQHRRYWDDDTVVHFVTLGVVPSLEVTGRITNFEGKLGMQYHDRLGALEFGGWNFDRAAGFHWRVVSQKHGWPVSFAVGSQDITGNSVFKARYAVASRRWSQLGVHAGVGDGMLKAFAGIDYQPKPYLRVLLDHDGTRANIGCTLTYRRISISPVLTGLKMLGGGVSYTQRL